MSGTVIGKIMNFGWIGKVSRDADTVIVNRIASEEIAFGAPVWLANNNKVRCYDSDDTVTNFVGFAVSEVMQSTSYDGTAQVKYPANKPCDILTRGSIVLKLKSGISTVNAGSAVYLDATTGEITNVSESNVALTNCKFTTGKIDANGCVEITILTKATI